MADGCWPPGRGWAPGDAVWAIAGLAVWFEAGLPCCGIPDGCTPGGCILSGCMGVAAGGICAGAEETNACRAFMPGSNVAGGLLPMPGRGGSLAPPLMPPPTPGMAIKLRCPCLAEEEACFPLGWGRKGGTESRSSHQGGRFVLGVRLVRPGQETAPLREPAKAVAERYLEGHC